ncbi:FG-GAP repeat domain-containing protein [Mumia sp. DW29H23]|uniref:FG-GAP repeat domain-containing protein n=1 Tax=Mumia sp. DW29H23 TaxID=3421241 RepID=UPI003D699CAD
MTANVSRRIGTAAVAAGVLLGTVAYADAAVAAAADRGRTPSKHATPTWDLSRVQKAKATKQKAAKTPKKQASQAPTLRALTAAAAATTPDVTGDGLADLVTQLSGPDAGALRLYDHNGATAANPWDGPPTTTVTAWDYADLVELGDLTGDGRAELVARDPNHDNGTLWVYPNTGDPADPWSTRVKAGTGWNIVDAIRIGDVSGDGLGDLVVREPADGGGVLWVYRGNGSTTSNPFTSPRVWSGSGWNLANALTLGDVTGDGRPDVVARDGGGRILVYPHNGATSTNYWTSIISGASGFGSAGRLELGDVTGDGRPDLVARSTAGDLTVYPFQGTTPGSMWATGQSFAAGTGYADAANVMLGDVDGDGQTELAVRRGSGQDLVIRTHDGSTSGNPWTATRSAGSDWGFAGEIMADDVNGDGLVDVIALERTAANGTLWIYLNNGATTGNPWPTRYFGGTGWNIFDALYSGDVDGDGLADLVGREPDGDLYAYPGNGSTTAFPWNPRMWVGSNWQTAAELAIVDLDDDGYGDLVDLERDGSLWLFPTASGDPVQVAGDWSDVRSLDVADTDGTGGLDLVVRDGDGAVWIHPGDGATTADPWTAPRRSGGTGYGNVISFGL